MQSVPRVAAQQSTIQQFNVQKPITRSYSTVQLTPSVLPVSDANRHKRRRRRPLPPIPSTAPAANTRSRIKALANEQAPPAATARHRPTRLPPIPRQNKGLSRLAKHVYELENDISQALEVMDAKTGNMLSYRQLMNHQDYRGEWSLSSANEFGRLANGVGNRIKKPSNTIRFMRNQDLPPDQRKDVTYGKFVCSVRPEKLEQNRTRLTIGGDGINYPGEVATPTAEMLVAKILFNSVVSTPGAQFMTVDISNFYLETPLKRPEYIRLKRRNHPRIQPTWLTPMAACTSKSPKGCMAYHKLVSLPTNSSSSDSTRTATTKASSYQVSGSMTNDRYNSPLLLTTSESSTSALSMLSTSKTLSNNTTR
eukprot:g6238.t1 g6238   contig22:44837-45934(+)